MHVPGTVSIQFCLRSFRLYFSGWNILNVCSFDTCLLEVLSCYYITHQPRKISLVKKKMYLRRSKNVRWFNITLEPIALPAC